MHVELTTELAAVNAELVPISPPTDASRARWEELSRDRTRLTNAIAHRPTRATTYGTLHTEANHLENPTAAIPPLTVNITTPVPRGIPVTRDVTTHFEAA